MKTWLYIAFMIFSIPAFSQDRDEISVLSKARLVHTTVFHTKDSSTLDKLFSEKLTYGHSSGKIENKQEAIKGIIYNNSVYDGLSLGSTSVSIDNNTAVTRYVMSAKEVKPNGSINLLKLHIMLVWVKEKKEWKLVARQAVKL